MYEIRDVVFGSENLLRDVNNEAFTNAVAKISMHSFQYALRLTDK
jgi:trehalose/maltose hydrolase-like predicted phosphorylase